MSYRLLALDMDGTLLTSDKHITRVTLDALRLCVQAGVRIALCTGRGLKELDDYADDLDGIVRYGSLVSGGFVYDFQARKAISVTPLATETVLEILAQAERVNGMVHILGTHESVIRHADLERMPEVGMGIYVPMFSSCCVFTDDLAAYAQAHGGEIIKVNIYHEDPAARDCSRRALSHLPLQLTDAETTSLESTGQGVTKARGLETLCTHLGISLADCVMVGDSSNDLEVLRVVGRPVAMGNATPEVLALAGDVVASNDDDGVAEVVRRIVLT